MSSDETLYRMGVVGSFAGFVGWITHEWLPMPATMRGTADTADLVLIGALMSLLIVMCGGRWWSERTRIRRALESTGALVFGAAAGFASASLIQTAQAWWVAIPYRLTVLLGWSLIGSMIGALIGLLRSGLMPLRLAISVVGGLVGGLAGGVFVQISGYWLPYIARALALTGAGFGIAIASTRAVDMFSRARLEFAGSDESEVQKYFYGRMAVWEFLKGDVYLFGNGHSPEDGGQFVHFPDAAMGHKHAVIRATDSGIQLKPHIDIQDPDGWPVFPLPEWTVFLSTHCSGGRSRRRARCKIGKADNFFHNLRLQKPRPAAASVLCPNVSISASILSTLLTP